MVKALEAHGSEFLTQRRKKYTKDEALAIIDHKSSAETRGRDTVHTALERLWFRCCAAYVDPKASRVDAVFNALDTAPMLFPEDTGYSANHIQGFVMRQVSRLCASKGRFKTLPKSADWRDEIAAKVGDHLLSHWHNVLNVRSHRRDLAFWQVVCGTGFVYTGWDQKLGSQKRVYINPLDETQVFTEDQLDPKTKAMYETLEAYSDVPEGDMEMEAIGPFQILVPSTYPRIENAPWMVIERIRSMEWMWRHYPKDAADLRPEDFLDSKISYWWRRLAGLVQRHGSVLPGTSNFADESVLVREFIRPPSPLVEQGAYIVACQSRVLANDPHPSFAHPRLNMRFPVRMARMQQVPGRLWGMGMVEHLIEPQIEYNKARSQIIMHRDVLSKPQWLMPRGTELTSTRNNIEDLWEYQGSRKPELVNPPAMSMNHVSTRDDAMNDMRLVASQTEVSQGQTIPGVRSGTAIRSLQERDMETIGPAYEEHEECMQASSSDILKLSAEFLTRPRAILIYGQDMAVDVQYFKGDDLRGNTEVRVSPGSMAPKSRAMEQENMMNLLQLGGMNLQDPDQARMVYEALGIEGQSDTFVLADRNKRRADIENDLFLNSEFDPVTGAPRPWPDVQDHDDHMIHIKQHTAMMLTDAWESADPLVKMATKAHVLKHNQAIAKLVMLQQQMQATQGPQGSEPKETGKASPPKRTESGA